MRAPSINVIVTLASLSVAVPLSDTFDAFNEEFKRDSPTVVTDYGTWVGASSSGVESFRGIPFAQPPVGSLRFAAPQPPNITYGTYSAQNWGYDCPQQLVTSGALNGLGDILGDVLNLVDDLPIFKYLTGTEDCLNLNVWRPAGVAGPLPVMFWIFGGGFSLGSTSTYDATTIVAKSIEIGKPVIVVSPNYRVSAYGFLPGVQTKAGGGHINAGLLDQRLAMKWVQKYISLFNGDPTRVTLFGESAGAISIGYHLVANGGDNEGLFHAAIMQSGSPLPTRGPEGGQASYDQIASVTGCDKTSDSFKCLQQLPFDTLSDAVDTLPGIFAYDGIHLPFLPRTDGEFITDGGLDLISQGKYAKVPIITGDCYDEGTLLTLGTLNVTTTAGVRNFLKTLFPNLSSAQYDKLLSLYPSDVTAGSPYNTWIFNNVSGQNKRIAAIVGDATFQAPRRFVLDVLAKTQKAWSYSLRAFMTTPILGSFHATDLILLWNILPLNTRLTNEIQTRWISFANNFDPNPTSGNWVNWPTYGDDKEILQFADLTTSLESDDFRTTEIAYIVDNAKDFGW